MSKRRRGTQQAGPMKTAIREVGPIPDKQAGHGTEKERGTAGGNFFRFLAPFLIVSGYTILHKAGAGGQSRWAAISAVFLLSGYLLIIPAILRASRIK